VHQPKIALAFAAIVWSKKLHHKDFYNEAKWIHFHKNAHRLLEAPTVAGTHLIQDKTVQWLKEIGKHSASKWFDNWTGEFDNYTNATAGYVDFNKCHALKRT
jgi:hypothetical protein